MKSILSTIKAEAIKRFDKFWVELMFEGIVTGKPNVGERVSDFLSSEIDRTMGGTVEDLEKWAKKVTTGNNGGEYPWIALNDLLQKLSSLKEK